MEKEQTKNSNDNYKKLKKFFYIAMLALFAIIAIILVDLIKKNEQKILTTGLKSDYDISDINVRPCEDYNLYKFIDDYFKARTNLNYVKIFSSFGRDYYSEEREDKDGSFKNIIDSIRYEKMFVRGYDNIKVYFDKGFYENEVICVVTYDMILGFTDDTAPMIIMFYLTSKDGTYTIKEDFDVGISKYIVDVANTASVKELYNDTYLRLNRVLESNESLRLSYNSLRQYEMNMSSDLGPLNKREMIESIGVKKLDPIKDAKKIYDDILESKEIAHEKEVLDNYIARVVASLSNAQRAKK